MQIVRLFTLIFSIFLICPSVYAAGSSEGPTSSSSADSTNISTGKKAIEDKDWNKAIGAFLMALEADPTNADAHNYLGYSYRNIKQYEKALQHYKEALNLNPKHKGAHEYVGETYLALNDLQSAKKHLAALDKICLFGCEEYDELKDAVEKYEKEN